MKARPIYCYTCKTKDRWFQANANYVHLRCKNCGSYSLTYDIPLNRTKQQKYEDQIIQHISKRLQS